MSASRRGVDNVYDPRADDFTDQRSTGVAGASRPPKMSKSTQKVFGFGFYLSMTQSDGKSESQLDLIDMNGDRFPDLVAPGSTQYTWADGTFFDTHGGGPARKSEDAQTTIGLSVGVPASRQSARAEISQGGDRDNGEKSSISIGASVNKGSNKTNEDLIDVNGSSRSFLCSVPAKPLFERLRSLDVHAKTPSATSESFAACVTFPPLSSFHRPSMHSRRSRSERFNLLKGGMLAACR